MKRLLVLLVLALALVGCTNTGSEIDIVTLYDTNGVAVAHYEAHANDWYPRGGYSARAGVSLTTTAGQHVDWSGAYGVVQEK